LTNSGRVKTRVRFAEQDAGKQSNHRTIDQMTDDTDNMNALSADRKPVVLISGQYEITVEIDNDGDVILRQEQQYGDHPDTIVIARANLSAFISDLIECALPELCFPPRCDASVRDRGRYKRGGTDDRSPVIRSHCRRASAPSSLA